VDERVREVIAEHLGTAPSRVLDEASFVSLGADSLDIVSLTMALEETFDIHIPDERAEACGTVGDVLGLIAECRSLRCASMSASPALADV
jgi:acyl carrier protein